MKARLKPLEYACERVEEPIIEDGALVGAPGDYILTLGSGTRLVCPADEFALHYDLLIEDETAAGGEQNADDA